VKQQDVRVTSIGRVVSCLLSVCIGYQLLSIPYADADAVGAFSEAEFKKGDVDRDGQLTLNEFDEYVIGLFSAADRNHDRFLDMKESGEHSSRDFARMDIDMDNKLSFQEVMRKAHINFRAADKNQDKMVSAAEARTFGG
jgi:hypothetical protein